MEFEKKNTKIYVLCGKSGNGKTLSSQIIEEYFSKENKKTVSLAYASYLKEYAKNVLGWDLKEETKPREFLQQLGDKIREEIDEKFLVKRIIDDIKIYSYFFDVIIVTDARFIDEIEIIKNEFSDVETIYLYGRENKGLTSSQKSHATEVSLDGYSNYDYEIDNSKTIEDLKNELEKILKEV